MDYNRIIESKGLKKNYVAKKLGVSRQFLYLCLNGKKKMPEKRRRMLHDLLNIHN